MLKTLRRRTASSFFRWLARLGLARLAALACRLSLKKVQTARNAPGQRRYTLLIFPKDGFTQDVMTALGTSDAVDVYHLPRAILSSMVLAYLPYFIDDNNYASAGPEFDDRKRALRAFLARLFRHLNKALKFEGIVSGNFSYHTDRELAAAVTDMGIHFIALHKENLKMPGRVALFERVYRERRGPFTGSRILVYNEIEKDLQIRTGVFDASRIDVVGMPRLDVMHEWRKAHAGQTVRNEILVFFFADVAGMPRIPRKKAGGGVYFEPVTEGADISLSELARETYATILKIARENPDITITVKTKGRVRDMPDVLRCFGLASEQDAPPNLRFVHTGRLTDLIGGASVVCGFNSTALLETVAAGKPLVMPWFGEVSRPEVQPYILDLRAVALAPLSPEALEQALLDAARKPVPVSPDLPPSVRETLRYWTGNDDGRGAERTYRALLAELERPLRAKG